MYDRWYLPVLAVLFISAFVQFLSIMGRRRRKEPAGAADVLCCALSVLLLLLAAALLPERLETEELSQYDRLFQADKVVCGGENVTQLFRDNAKSCWDYREMEPYEQPESGDTVGTLLFYRDGGQRTFEKISVVRLKEATNAPRVCTIGGGSYLFRSESWKSRGYVYGFSQTLARELIEWMEQA